ncbi:MAG: chemotaxis protein CheW [Gemmatimonadales bacterium]|jgi:chemotaxis signal transduction protein
MSAGAGHLLVRANQRLVGLPLTQVVEVLDPGAAFPVPSTEPAIRGVAVVRGRILPLLHLGALLEGTGYPDARSELGVLIDLAGRRVCLEVEAAETVLYEPGLPVAPGAGLPWAAGVARTEHGLIPLLDLTALGTRITEASAA